MKLHWLLAILAFVVLGFTAVWVGGLNQDEGWYLYAANLVADGQLPYRDFFYTQGPVMPIVYSAFTRIWRDFGILGARVFNLVIGFLSIVFACALAQRLAKKRAGLVTFFLLATNLYHLYYLAIPKTYALAGLFVMAGFFLLSFERAWAFVLSSLLFVLAAGTRFSLGAILPVVTVSLIWKERRGWPVFVLCGLLFGCLLFGSLCCDYALYTGFLTALSYHSSRGGADIVWTVGSLSRLVRWYLPVFVVLGLGVAARLKSRAPEEAPPVDDHWLLTVVTLSFLAVFAVQILAPFPYEDYQVPIMSLLAVVAAVTFVSRVSDTFAISTSNLHILLVLGLCFASSFGSPLLEKWMMNGQDRFWSLKKSQTELAQLREVARRIETLDPGGKTLLTQDLYLAIETNRKVPKGLEMGPFAMLSDDAWRTLLTTAHETCPVAALSGYSFAIDPPVCSERPIAEQLEFWRLLEQQYVLAFREEYFGQNATALLVLKKKGAD